MRMVVEFQNQVNVSYSDTTQKVKSRCKNRMQAKNLQLEGVGSTKEKAISTAFELSENLQVLQAKACTVLHQS